MIGIIFLVILVVIAVVLMGMYNRLVQLRVRCDSTWSDIDVQLKRRHDLIPNLVETVKGYAAHEKGTFDDIAKWYQPEAQTLWDMFSEVGLEEHYNEAYRPLSGIEHSDTTTYLPMLMSMEQNKEDEIRLEILNDVNVPDYLRNAFQYFGEIFKLCNEGNRLADGTRLQQILSDGVEFYKVEMQSRGISPS